MKNISTKELREILARKEKGNAIVIDVRTKEEHEAGRIADVVNMPLDEIEQRAEELKKYETVYVHCQSGARSSQACAKLETLGLTNLMNVEGGLSEWERLGFAVCRTKHCRMPLMQQVLLTAGVFILLGFLLATLIHPYFLALPVVVGMGLTFAGATGKCFMMMVLVRMPWNK